jgi:methionine synthase II (cobalamin-independent)
MALPTEPIGSIPRPPHLIAAAAAGGGTDPALDPLYDEAVRDTVARFEATGSPVVTDGEQRKYHNFWTYCVHGLPNTAPGGFAIPFRAGHVRVPVKPAVIPPSAPSLMDPDDEIPGYLRERFIRDHLGEHEREVRACLRKGAHAVQVDSTEGRLAVKVDPTRGLLRRFIDLIRDHLRPGQRVFVGVVAPIDPRVEAPEEVRDRVPEAADSIPVAQLGTTDDCGSSPFSDDTSTTRETAFEKVRARVVGTALAGERLGVG